MASYDELQKLHEFVLSGIDFLLRYSAGQKKQQISYDGLVLDGAKGILLSGKNVR